MIISSRLETQIIRSICMTFLAVSLLAGGIVILLSKIPGWSLFFGLIIAPIGVVLTILTLDDVAKGLVIPPPFKQTKCKVCGKMTYAEENIQDFICGRCREDITEKIFEERKK